MEAPISTIEDRRDSGPISDAIYIDTNIANIHHEIVKAMQEAINDGFYLNYGLVLKQRYKLKNPIPQVVSNLLSETRFLAIKEIIYEFRYEKHMIILENLKIPPTSEIFMIPIDKQELRALPQIERWFLKKCRQHKIKQKEVSKMLRENPQLFVYKIARTLIKD